MECCSFCMNYLLSHSSEQNPKRAATPVNPCLCVYLLMCVCVCVCVCVNAYMFFCRFGPGRRTCGKKREERCWRGTQWSRADLHHKGVPFCPRSPSIMSWSLTSSPPTTAQHGTPLDQEPWSSRWRRQVRKKHSGRYSIVSIVLSYSLPLSLS